MKYSISFIYKSYFTQNIIDSETKEVFTIGSGKKDDIIFEKLKAKQILVRIFNNNVSVENKLIENNSNQPRSIPCILPINGIEDCYIYLDNVKSGNKKVVDLPHNGKLTIGRKSINDVVIKCPFISGLHCVITRENGVFYVQNLSKTNGTYVNSIKISKTKIASGDVIYLFSYKIRLDKGLLYFENCGNDIEIKELEGKVTNLKGSSYKKGNKRIYRRSPRTQEALPTEDIVLAAPPSRQPKYEKRRGMFSSIVSSAAMMGTSLLTGGAVSAAMIAARSSMLIMPATSLATQNSDNKRSKKKANDYEKLRELRFGNYLNEQRARISSIANQQIKIFTDENPSPEECLTIVKEMKRNLWERNSMDRDFLDVRLGMGYEKLCVNVKDRGEALGIEMEDDDAKEMSAMLVEESKYVDNIPVRLSFTKNNTIGFIGNRDKVIQQVKNMIAELTCMHCYTDVKIVGIFDESERKQWESLRWLPHFWDDDKQVRFISFDQENAHALCESFNDMLKAKKRDLKDSMKKQVPIPYYIFILGSKTYMEHEEIMQNLDIDRVDMGVTSLFLFDDIYNLPSFCNYIVDFTADFPAAYRRDEINSKFLFSMDKMSYKEFDNLARSMASIDLQGFATAADIPNAVTFLEGYGVEKVEDLNILNRWNNNLAYKSLAAPIGVMGGDKTFYFNIRESKGSPNEHGPHGLVAGTTGSGKSELLQTWILSMCVNYHPNEVNFVLIDYKGGGMANLLEAMPHVVGKITNIASNIKRSIISLNREKDRRMEMFAAAGSDVNNIDKYQKLYHAGKVREPLPHLIIVADEFAELKKEEPEFISNLVTIARVGRTLGIHLVLATQKPSGIVDEQISGNSRFRLCLKVQDASDSREMIGRPDASHITNAGRCYVKVGDNEVFELFQSYWSGAPYSETKEIVEDDGNNVAIVEYNGSRKYIPNNKPKKKAEFDELGAINKYICNLAEENGIHQLQGPWLDELPENLWLKSIVDSNYSFDGEKWSKNRLPWLKIPVGKYDVPELQEQGVMCMDLSNDGHYGIYGASGTGKTTLLKTMIISACLHYTPEDIVFYILDCGGWSLNSLADFPHVGDVALDVEEEKINKLKELLENIIVERRKLFLENKVSSLAAYREIVGKLPAIVLVIDNILPVFDNFPDLEELLIRISRDGATYGIYLIYTANTNTGIRFKVVQNIKGAIAFELTDKGDYAAIVGRMEDKFLPRNSGRAFFKSTSPMEFQVSWYAEGDNEIQRVSEVQQMAKAMSKAWKGELPESIPVMPETVSFDSIKNQYKDRTKLPIGISYNNISVKYLDLNKRYGMIVSGSIGSGKSGILRNFISILSENEQNDIYLIDSQKKEFSDFYSTVKGYCCDNDADGVKEVLGIIAREMNTRKEEQNNAIENGMPTDVYAYDKRQICIVLDDITEFINLVEEELQTWLINISSYAEGLGVIVIAAIRSGDLANMAETEALTNALVSYQNAVVVDGSASNVLCFQNNLSYEEKERNCSKGDVLVFDNGECQKIKIAD